MISKSQKKIRHAGLVTEARSVCKAVLSCLLAVLMIASVIQPNAVLAAELSDTAKTAETNVQSAEGSSEGTTADANVQKAESTAPSAKDGQNANVPDSEAESTQQKESSAASDAGETAKESDKQTAKANVADTANEMAKNALAKAEAEATEKDSFGLPVKTEKLSDIIDKDKSDDRLAYSTLFDKDMKVINTNDPQEKTDEKYSSHETAKNAAVYLKLRFAALIRSGRKNKNGIQENVTYTMDLPDEIIPSMKDKKGNTIVNPEKPQDFIKVTGKVTAKGGIYSDSKGKYSLKMYFENTEGQRNISAYVQYSGNLSSSLESGKTYMLKTIPGRDLEFSIEKEETPDSDKDYLFNIKKTSDYSSGSGSQEDYLIATLKCQKETAKGLPYDILNVATSSETGFEIDQGNFDICMNELSGSITESGKEYSLDFSYDSSSSDALENRKAQYKATANGTEITVSFDSPQSSNIQCFSSGAGYSYIAQHAEVRIKDSDASDISSLSIRFPYTRCNDYSEFRNGSAEAYADSTREGEYEALHTKCEISTDFDATASIKEYPLRNTIDSSSLFHEKSIQDRIDITTSADANAISMEISPQSGNLASYYFFNNLLDQDSDSFPIVGITGYEKGSHNFHSFERITDISDDKLNEHSGITDVKSLYEIRLISAFEDSRMSDFLIFRSKSPSYSYNKGQSSRYSYMIISKQTASRADACKKKGWKILANDRNQKPYPIKVYFVNVKNYSYLNLTLTSHLGAVNATSFDSFRDYRKNADRASVEVSAAEPDSNCLASAEADVKESENYQNNSQCTLIPYRIDSHTVFWSFIISPSFSCNDGLGKSKLMLSLPDGVHMKPVKEKYLPDPIYYVGGNSVMKSPCNGNSYIVTNKFDSREWNSRDIPAPSVTKDVKRAFPVFRDLIYSTNFEESVFGFDQGSEYVLDLGSICSDSSYINRAIVLGFETETDQGHEGANTIAATFAQQTGDINGDMDKDRDKHSNTCELITTRETAVGYCPVPHVSKELEYKKNTENEQRATWMVDSRLSKTVSFDDSPKWLEYVQKATREYGDPKYYGHTYDHNYYNFNEGYQYESDRGQKLEGAGLPGAFCNGTMLSGDIRITDFSTVANGDTDILKNTYADNIFGSTPTSSVSVPCGTRSDNVIYSSSHNDAASVWEKYNGESDKWENKTWDRKKPGIYRVKSKTPYGDNSDMYPVYIYYAGNMGTKITDVTALVQDLKKLDEKGLIKYSKDDFSRPFVIEFSDLARKSNVYFTYDTVLDMNDYLKGKSSSTIAGGTEMSNFADDSTYQYQSKYHSDSGTFYIHPFTASLAVRKDAIRMYKTYDSGDREMMPDCSRMFTVTAMNGIQETSSMTVKDFIKSFRSSFSEVISNSEGLKKVTDAVDVTNMIIRMTDADGKTEMVYSDGKFTDKWKDSVLKVKPDNASGQLYELKVISTDKIAPQSRLTITYRIKPQLDRKTDGGTSLRESDYYSGGNLTITTGVTAEKPYSGTDANENTLKVDGGTINSKIADTSDTPGIKQGETHSLDGGEPTTEYTVTKYSGNAGKDCSMSINDIMHFKFNIPKEIPEEKHESIQETLDHIASRHTTIKNFRIYRREYNKVDEYYDEGKTISKVAERINKRFAEEKNMTANKITDNNIEVEDPIYGVARSAEDYYRTPLISVMGLMGNGSGNALEFSGGTDMSETRFDKNWDYTFKKGKSEYRSGSASSEAFESLGGGSEKFTLTYNNTDVNEGWDEKEKKEHISNHPIMFSFSGKNLNFNTYYILKYDVKTDWEAVWKEFLQVFYDAILAHPEYADKIFLMLNSAESKNGADGGIGENAWRASAGSEIKVGGFSIEKEGKKTEDGIDWTSHISAGYSDDKHITISDSPHVNASDDRIKKAAEKALSLKKDSLKIVMKKGTGSTTLYENGKAADGYDDKVTVIFNEDGSFSFDYHPSENISRSEFECTYHYDLDADAFFKNGGKKDDAFTVANKAGSTYDGHTYYTEKNIDEKPDEPLSSSKTLENTDGNRLKWKASANTGNVSRRNFALEDSLESEDKNAVRSSSIEDIEATVIYSDGHSEKFDMNELKSRKMLKEPLLTDDGKLKFSVAFDSLPAHASVSLVYYSVTDRNAYLKAGGKDDSEVSLKNTVMVSSSDGYSDSSSAEGKARIVRPFVKKGKISEDETYNGHPVSKWTLEANLTEKVSAEDLAKAKTATVSDSLSEAIEYIDGSAVLTDMSGNEIDKDDYTISYSDHTLKAVIKKPNEHPSVRIVFSTEILVSAELPNSADIKLDEKPVSEDSTEIPKADVADAFRAIRSEDSYAVTVRKNTTGNFGDRNRYFRFRFSLKGAEDDQDYNIRCTSDKTGKGEPNPVKITTDGDGNGTAEFYLKSGDTAVISGLPKEATYSAEEIRAAGYDTSIEVNGEKAEPVMYAENGDMLIGISRKVHTDSVVFTNSCEGVLPTGVRSRMAISMACAAVILLILSAAAYTEIIYRKKKEN